MTEYTMNQNFNFECWGYDCTTTLLKDGQEIAHVVDIDYTPVWHQLVCVNLTQHIATKEQEKEFVIEPLDKEAVKALLTFTKAPTQEEMENRAKALVQHASINGSVAVMVGGAPYFMPTLVRVLKEAGLYPVCSFSERVSVEVQGEDGSVTKQSVFKHTGWVEC